MSATRLPVRDIPTEYFDSLFANIPTRDIPKVRSALIPSNRMLPFFKDENNKEDMARARKAFLRDKNIIGGHSGVGKEKPSGVGIVNFRNKLVEKKIKSHD